MVGRFAYLASVNWGTGGPHGSSVWFFVGIPVAAIATIVFLLALNGLTREEPKITGPALVGTTRVLSMKTDRSLNSLGTRPLTSTRRNTK